jgi:sulfite exporter TauE/SafE
MDHHLTLLAALCGPDGPAGAAGMALALLVAGLVGSVAHCAPMCGPFVLAQVSSNLSRISAARLCERQRFTGGMLLPYHLGRMATYAGLGAIAASTGAAVGAWPRMQWIPPALLLLGAALFLVQALYRIFPATRLLAKLLPRMVAPWVGSVARLAGRIDRSRPQGGFLLGVVLGFLPCGFFYAALAVAASSAHAASGALAMAAFALGTMPSLIVLGIAGQAGGRAWGKLMITASPALLLLNAGLLASMAWQRLLAVGTL